MDAGRNDGRCAVCGQIGQPWVKMKDEYICLACTKMHDEEGPKIDEDVAEPASRSSDD
jgi:hypothetical protein